MNSRSGVNETNLVNFPADLPTLNQLDAKEGLLSFPFDHIYACHSDSAERNPTLQLDKAPESIDLVETTAEISKLKDQLTASENQKTKLKNLLVYHLDLIQQQNEYLSKREKSFQSLKQENELLRVKLGRMDQRIGTLSQRHAITTSSGVHIYPPPTSTVVKPEPEPPQIMLNAYADLLLPNETGPTNYLFGSDIVRPKPFIHHTFDVPTSSEPDVSSYLPREISVPSILDPTLNCPVPCEYKMIDSKHSFVKKEMKTEASPEALYTVTSNSGNTIIQRIQRNKRKTTSTFGSLSRITKSPKADIYEPSKGIEEEKYIVNKKCKMINTYGKPRNDIKPEIPPEIPPEATPVIPPEIPEPGPDEMPIFTGSLSDRLQLIDTTPTGEDPYLLGEADMREQSPIPKLMLQKGNHGRMKVCPRRRIYETVTSESSKPTKSKLKQRSKKVPKTMMVMEPDLDLVKTETQVGWRLYTPENDFSLTNKTDTVIKECILPIFQGIDLPAVMAGERIVQLDTMMAAGLSALVNVDSNPVNSSNNAVSDVFNNVDNNVENDHPQPPRTIAFFGVGEESQGSGNKRRVSESKRGRKRALSTGLMKRAPQKALGAKAKLVKGRGGRGKRSPVPGMVTNRPYHTQVGDPDTTWYVGLDPDLKMEDVDTNECKAASVEVPRWREKLYTSCYTLEGTENLDDKVFEKRHQKLEAEERRQLRWHMRRIREQRHVERLRQRQRDWCSSANQPPPVYSLWPRPQRDVHFIEITDTLPVMAFGENIPDLPRGDFVLPWVMTTKAMKRSKRSKTLH